MTAAERLQELSRTVCREWIAVDELGAALGTVVSRSESWVSIRPTDAAFAAATLAVDPTGALSHVKLEMAHPAQVPLRSLAGVFGEHRTVPRRHPGDPRRVAFRADAPELPFTCTVIAELERGAPEDGGSPVRAVTLRRDPPVD